jgi:hypothetical protein
MWGGNARICNDLIGANLDARQIKEYHWLGWLKKPVLQREGLGDNFVGHCPDKVG